MDCFMLDNFQHRHQWGAEVERELRAQHGGSESQGGDLNSVCVYGPSQVGKTTLILYLLGIDSPHIDKVLRGGRKTGQSSTASAVQYLQSPDNCWHLEFGSLGAVAYPDAPVEFKAEKRYEGNLDVQEYLDIVRGECSKGGLKASTLLKIWLPAQYFGQDGALCNTQLIDIPGINSSDRHEKEYVRSICEKYLPSSNLVLIVTNVNNLKSLRPPPDGVLGDWTAYLDHYRFVVTRVASAHSMQEYLSVVDGKLPLDEIREKMTKHVASEAMRFDKGVGEIAEAELSGRLYCFELGDSLRALKKESLRFDIEDMISQERQELIKDVKTNASLVARLRFVFGEPAHKLKSVEKHKAMLNKRIQRLEGICSKQQGEIEKIETTLIENQGVKKKLLGKYESLLPAIKKAFMEISREMPVGDLDKKTPRTLTDSFEGFLHNLKRFGLMSALNNKLRLGCPLPSTPTIANWELLSDAAKEWGERFDGYWGPAWMGAGKDAYRSDSTRKDDIDLVMKAVSEAKENFRKKCLYKYRDRVLKTTESFYQKQIDEIDGFVASRRYAKSRLGAKQKILQKRIDDILHQISKLDDELANTRKFVVEYSNALFQKAESVAQDCHSKVQVADPLDSMVYSLSALNIHLGYLEIMEGQHAYS
jgi:GTPase SAR1 family protein/uncharacterized coiled-coil protein SlyX